MLRIRSVRTLLLALALPGSALPAQAVADYLARGTELHRDRYPQAALEQFEAALRLDSTSYEANWRAAEALVDVGKQTPDSVQSPERDSLYARAERYARRAVESNPQGTDGHAMLAVSIGRASLTKSSKERVRRAAEVRSEALRAIELDSANDRAYHVLGRWNAEIMRLSGLQRFFAKTFLGGKIMGEASWQGAIDNLERATTLAPDVIYHHLVLAEVLIDRKRYQEARDQLQRVTELPVFDVMDPAYQQEATRLLTVIADRPDQD
jgi:tetratricopeptide (TPR) repeat protein